MSDAECVEEWNMIDPGENTGDVHNAATLQKSLDDSLMENELLKQRLAEISRSNRQESECVVCQDLNFEPYLLSCGHLIGGDCLQTLLEMFGRQSACPLCRKFISHRPYFSYSARAKVVAIAEADNIPVPPLTLRTLTGPWE
ncbi:hypothetical protein EV715DRAFT_268428 [Schizophyllum commune]